MERLALTDYPLALLRAHPRNNYRLHDMPFLKELLRAGQHRTIAVRADDTEKPLEGGEVLAGLGVVKAARELGMETVGASVIACDETEAMTIIAGDNRSQERGGIDDKELVALLSDLRARDQLALAGYNDEDLLVLRHQGEAPEATALERRGGAGTPVVLQTLLNFHSGGDYDRFMRQVLRLRVAYGVEDSALSPVVLSAVMRQAGA